MERISYVGFSSNATTHLAMAEMMTMTRMMVGKEEMVILHWLLLCTLYPQKTCKWTGCFVFRLCYLARSKVLPLEPIFPTSNIPFPCLYLLCFQTIHNVNWPNFYRNRTKMWYIENLKVSYAIFWEHLNKKVAVFWPWKEAFRVTLCFIV